MLLHYLHSFFFLISLVVNNYKGVLDSSSVTSRVSLKGARGVIVEPRVWGPWAPFHTLAFAWSLHLLACLPISKGGGWLPTSLGYFVYWLVIFIHVSFSIRVLGVTTLGTTVAQHETFPYTCDPACGQTPTSRKSSKESGRLRPLLSFYLETWGLNCRCQGQRAEMLLVLTAEQRRAQRIPVSLKIHRACFGFLEIVLSISLLGGFLHFRFESK